MQPEVELLLKQYDAIDNDCKDALIASWDEVGIKKELLMDIYKKKDIERAKISKEINRLCQIK